MRSLFATAVIAISSLLIPLVTAPDAFAYPVSIPQECVQLARREGVPVILKNERQANHAREKLAELNDREPSVRECRQAVRRAMAQYGQ